MRSPRPTFLFLIAALGAVSAPAAHAVGTRVDVQIVDRSTGETLTPYEHDGQWWIAGRPGAKYRVVLRNHDGRRALGVLSIDGVNAISGDTAAWNQTGYVLDPHEQVGIDGWRKNMAQLAAFEFANLPDSYAARTGRPGNVGVIGVAVFDERPVVRPILRRDAAPASDQALPSSAGGESRAEPVPAPPAQSPVVTAKDSDSLASPAKSSTPLARAERLGTGHGAIEQSMIRYVDFQRARPAPDEIVTIHYDRMENLVAMGIVPGPPIAANPPVDPFPNSHRYVPDPPPRR